MNQPRLPTFNYGRDTFCFPDHCYKLACFIGDHFAFDDLTEEALFVLRANRDEIRATAGVVVSPQPNGAAMMYSWVVCHAGRL
jgi:hypothetical protein